jgi:hypothetical protein
MLITFWCKKWVNVKLFLYMETSGEAGAPVGGYFGPLSSVTVFQVLASEPFTEKSKRI